MQGPVACDVCVCRWCRRLDHWLSSSSRTSSARPWSACAVLPPPVVQECIKLVDTYIPTLVDVLSRLKF